MLQVGDNMLSYVGLVIIMACFHFATLEEYYVGSLDLPACNGVSEGSLVIILLFVVTGICGSDIWTKPAASGSWLHIEGI